METRSLLDDGDGGCGAVIGIVERPRTVSGIVPCALLCCCDAEGFCCTYCGFVSRSILRLNDTISVDRNVWRHVGGLFEGEVEEVEDGGVVLVAVVRRVEHSSVVIFEDGFQRALFTPLNVEVVDSKVRGSHTCVRIGSSYHLTVVGVSTLHILGDGTQHHRPLVDISRRDSSCSSIACEAIAGSNNLCTGHRSRRVCPVGRDGAVTGCLGGRYGRTEVGSTVIFCTISRISDGRFCHVDNIADNNLIDLEAAGLSLDFYRTIFSNSYFGAGILAEQLRLIVGSLGIGHGEAFRITTTIVDGQLGISRLVRQNQAEVAGVQ